MRLMIRKLIEDAGLEFGENVSDGNGGTAWYGGRRKSGGWVVAGNSVRQVRQSISDLRKRDEKKFISRAMKENGLRLSTHERSVWKNGVPVEEILYKGWNDDGEEVISGSCLGEVLESIEKWQEHNALLPNELESPCSEEGNVFRGFSWKGKMTLMEHNVNAEHFFCWLRKRLKDFSDDEASRIWWLERFEEELYWIWAVQFTLPGEDTKDGLDHTYREFEWVWIGPGEDYLEEYVFVHGNYDRDQVRLDELADCGYPFCEKILSAGRGYIALAKVDTSENIILFEFPETYGDIVHEYRISLSEPSIQRVRDIPELEFLREKKC